MKVEAVTRTPFTNTRQYDKHTTHFSDVLLAAQQAATHVQTKEKAELSFKEMIDIEHKAIVALRQGDLLGHEQYKSLLSGHDSALERINTAAAAYTNEAGIKNDLFPDDAPQAVKNYVAGLSMKERMVMFTQVAVQDITANAYQDSNGHWRIRHRDEQGYINVFEQPDFSYTKLVDSMLAYIEANRAYTTQQNYEQQRDVVLGLKDALQKPQL